MPTSQLSPSKLSTIVDSLSDPVVVVDSQWQLTYINRQAQIYWQREGDDLLGQSLWQEFPQAVGSEVYRQLTEAMESGDATEFEARSPTSGRWLRLRVHPLDQGMLIYFQDISEHRQFETRLKAEHAVTQILAESHSLESAAPAIIDAICEGLEASAGSLWVADDKQAELRCVEIFSQAKSKEVEAFIEKTRNIHFRRGQGLPGRVWETLSPAWIADLADDENFPRAHLAANVHLQSAFAFPVQVGGRFFGVMEFFTAHRVELAAPMLQMMASIGSEIGQFIQRWQAEQDIHTAELHHRAVLESSLDCIITMDRDGLITEFNPAAEETFGYSRAQVLGEPLADCIVPEEYRAAHWKGLKRFLEYEEGPVLGTRIELPALRADGSTFPAELAITHKQLPSGEPLFTGYLRDISERKLFESQLLEAKEKAEEMTQLKSSMLRNMSHEIRTPLTSLLAWTSILDEIDPTDERHPTAVATIRRSAHRLSDTLDSVLTLAQLEGEALQFRLEPVDLCALVAETCQEFQASADEKGLWLRQFCEAPAIRADLDATLLRRILVNLISNGLKFTETGGVSVSILDEGEDVAIRVRDTGIGISEDFLPRLFEEFHQESTGYARTHEGAGLGLAITQRLVEQMGGSITANSNQNRGTTITISFPQLHQREELKEGASGQSGEPSATQSQPEQAQPEQTQPEQGQSEQGQPDPGTARILLVEDNASISAVVTDTLRKFATVRDFADAESALKCAEREAFDLILMDISLPGMNGVEASKRLRQMQRYAQTPIIAITGHALPGDRERLMRECFDGYIAKPFTLEALTEQVNSTLQDAS